MSADLDELAAWCRDRLAHAQLPDGHPLLEVAPKDLQRPPWRLTFNAACSALEALEARGDLERVPGPALAWRPASQGPGLGKTPSGGYALPLSKKEHGALLRLLDSHFDDLGDWQPSSAQHLPGHGLRSGDTTMIRAIRSRLKRP